MQADTERSREWLVRHRIVAPDPGITLVEILVAVVLMGTAIVAVLAALGTSIRGSATFEKRVTGLSVIETASAAVTERQRTCGEYQDVARDAVAIAGVGDPDGLTISGADCSGPLHRVPIAYVDPATGTPSSLVVTVSEFRTDPEPFGGDDSGVGGSDACTITAVSPSPPTMGWWPEAIVDPAGPQRAVLDQDVVVSVATHPDCGQLRAVLGGSPPIATVEMSKLGANNHVFVVNGRDRSWPLGPVAATYEQRRSTGWSTVSASNGSPLFTVENEPCVIADGSPIAVPASMGTGTGANSNTLNDPVTIRLTTSGACGPMHLWVDTGFVVIGPTPMARSGSAYEYTFARRAERWTLTTHLVRVTPVNPALVDPADWPVFAEFEVN